MKKVIREFECAMCGQCCANQDLVQLTTYELYKLAEHLDMTPVEFFGKYCELTATNLNPSLHLYIKTNNGACPFLVENKCSVHEARPYACRAYPMRVYWSPVADAKEFARKKYPMLESTCSVFKLDDGDVLLGDFNLLAKQTISYWVDDAYYNAAREFNLSIPYRAADHFIHDEEMREIAKRYTVNPQHPPSAFEAERAYARITLTLQSLVWATSSAFIPVMGQSVKQDERIGKYLLLTTDDDSVKALKLLVESGRMDLARTLEVDSKIYEDRHVIGAIYGSSSDHLAIGCVFDLDCDSREELTKGGTGPLYAFFASADGTQMVGFKLA